jgi:hypothetical protein
MGDQPVAKSLLAHRTAQIQNTCTQISMPQVGFKPTIPVFEGAKRVHISYPTGTVIGSLYYARIKIFNSLPSDLKILMNEKAQFKIALKRYSNTHSFYSVVYLLSKNCLLIV